LGDLAYKDFDPTIFGTQTQVDALGNIIQIPDQVEAKEDQLFGSENSDHIQSGSLNDIVKGKGGDDMIEGGSGTDILIGGANDDRLFADSEADFASAFNSNNTPAGTTRDWLAGGDGNDQLIGSTGTDVLSGGGGHDLLVGGAGNDYIFGDRDRVTQSFNWSVTRSGVDYIFSPVIESTPSDPNGADAIFAGGGDDIVWAGGGNDNVFGGSGNDYLLGEDGNDNLLGDAGNDTLSGGLGEDLLIGDIGNDLLFGGENNDLLHGNDGEDELQGGEGEDKLFGGDGNDLLIGNQGIDMLMGGRDNDQLQGHEDNDILKGGQGDDTLVGGSGDDTLIGGTENDLLLGDYSDNKVGVLNQLPGNDILKGGSGNDRLYGFEGNDELTGGTGNDLLKGGENNDQYFLTIGDGQDTIDDDEGENKLIFGITQTTLLGSFIKALDGFNYLALQYGDNDIVYIKDGLQGTIETYSINGTETHYSELMEQVFNEAIDYQMTANSGALYASRFNDTLKGSHTADIIFGQDGDDIVIGGVGSDTLNGGPGSDWLQGGIGEDTLVFSDDATWSSHFLAYNAGSPGQRGTGERISITNMQRSHDLFDGGEGQDTIQGSDDNDAIFLHDTFSPLPNGTGPRIKNVERFDMGSGDDIVDLTSPTHSLGNVILNGDAGNDVLWGSSGNDLLNGGQGNDRLSGGTGNDTYLFSRGDNQDIIREKDSTVNNHDVLSFLHDINHNQLWFSQDNDDLRINVIGSQDQVTIANWYNGTTSQVEEIQASDGLILANNQIDQLVQAMASFNPPAAGEFSLSNDQQQQLTHVLAASWT
jgi:Ca2+-binding RTX toxin-like protein